MCHHFSQSHYGLRSPFPAGLFQYERVTWSGAGLVNPKFYPTLSKIETRKLQEADPGWLISINQGNLNRGGWQTPVMCHHFSQRHYGFEKSISCWFISVREGNLERGGLVNPEFYTPGPKTQQDNLKGPFPCWYFSV
jgi:hypothetical protein